MSNLALKGYILPSDAFGSGVVNGSLWSIGYEAWCYLGVLGLGIVGLLRVRPLLPAVALIVLLGRAWLNLTGRHPAGALEPVIGPAYWWFVVLPPFALSAAMLTYGQHIPRSRVLLAVLIAATVGAAHLPIEPLYATALTRFLIPPMLCYATMYFAFSPLILPDPASKGDLSYGTYLYAFPIQQVLASTVLVDIGFAPCIFLSMVLALLAGALSWIIVERWAVKPMRRQASMPLSEEAALAAP